MLLLGVIDADDGFFKRGKFDSDSYSDPWINGTKM